MEKIDVELGLVSVVMPVYNGAGFIGIALESVIAQSYASWELLVVDDASTDDTRAILEQYSRRDVRIRPIFRSVNSGGTPGVPKNDALKAARGEFVAFLDADDEWIPGKLEAQVSQLVTRPDVVLSYVLYTTVTGEIEVVGTLLPPVRSRYRGNAFHALYFKPVLPNSGVMITRRAVELAGLLDEDPRVTEDGDYWLRIARIGAIDYVNGEPLLRYRVLPESHSSGLMRPFLRMIAVSWKHRPHAGWVAFVRNVIAYSTIYIAKLVWRVWHLAPSARQERSP